MYMHREVGLTIMKWSGPTFVGISLLRIVSLVYSWLMLIGYQGEVIQELLTRS